MRGGTSWRHVGWSRTRREGRRIAFAFLLHSEYLAPLPSKEKTMVPERISMIAVSLYVLYLLFPLSVVAEDNNQGVMRMDSKQKVIFTCPTNSMEEFRRLAKQAAELGATHVSISDLPKSRWQWDLDRNDPYPNWGMLVTSIFKVVVPEELK
jgi:hypothetical protein